MKNEKVFFCGWQSCVLFLFLSAFVGGCGASPQSLKRSLEIEKHFESATILPGYTYYVQGSAPDPEAIIALEEKYQLQSRLWTRVEWTEKEMARIIFLMQSDAIGFCTIDGGNMIAPDGQIIGFWYSQRDSSLIKQPEPGVVEIYPFDYTSSSPCYRHFLQDER